MDGVKLNQQTQLSVHFHGMFSFQRQANNIVVRPPIVGPEVGSWMKPHLYEWGTNGSRTQIQRGESIRVRSAARTPQGTALNLVQLNPGPGVDTTLQHCSIRFDLPDKIVPQQVETVDVHGPIQSDGKKDIPLHIQFVYTASKLTVTPDVGDDKDYDTDLHFYAEPSAGIQFGDGPFTLFELPRMHGLKDAIIVSRVREVQVPACFSVEAP